VGDVIRSFRLPKDVVDSLHGAAAESGSSVNELAVQVLREGLGLETDPVATLVQEVRASLGRMDPPPRPTDLAAVVAQALTQDVLLSRLFREAVDGAPGRNSATRQANVRRRVGRALAIYRSRPAPKASRVLP
jgi:hypothetical protein